MQIKPDSLIISIPDELGEELESLARGVGLTLTAYTLRYLEALVKVKRERKDLNTTRTLEELLATEPIPHWIEAQVVVVSEEEIDLLERAGAVFSGSTENKEGQRDWRTYDLDGKVFLWEAKWLKELESVPFWAWRRRSIEIVRRINKPSS